MKWFRKRGDLPADERRFRILAVSMSLDDTFLLERLAKRHHWDLRLTNVPQEGFRLASSGRYRMILCDRNQPGYPWREVMSRLSSSSPRSCILLVAPVHQAYVWRDVLQQGGHDILSHPLQEDALLQLVAALQLNPVEAEVSKP